MKRASLSPRVLFIVMTAAALQSCGGGAKREKEAAEKTEASAAPAIETVALQKGQLSTSLQIPGELTAYQQVDLYAKVSSFVKRMYADVGSEVSAGQLLATMEAPEMSSQLSGAQARLKSQEAIYLSSKATYDRLVATSKTPGTVSQNELDVAAARQKSDKAQLEAARAGIGEVGANQNYLQIRAPFAGVISARNVSAGAYVGPTGKGSDQPIFTLQEERRLRLSVSVPSSYTAYMTPGTAVTFTIKSLPNQTFHAKVARLAGALDLRFRSQRTEMDVDNGDKKLMPGMVAEVSFPLDGNASTFIVPAKAVLNATTGVFIIKIAGGRTQWVPVKTGRSDAGKTEVFGDGLTDGDTIVKTASEEMRDGAPAGKMAMKQ